MTAPDRPTAVRPLRLGEAGQAARLHLAACPDLDPSLLESLYRALATSPLAAALALEQGGQLRGLAVAAVDPERLASDLLSRALPQLLVSSTRRPRALLRLLRATLVGPRGEASGTEGRILAFVTAPDLGDDPARLDLLSRLVEELERRGCASVGFQLPAPLAPSAALAGDARFQVEAGPGGLQRGRRAPLAPDPDRIPGPFTWEDRLRCLLRLELLVLAPIYGLALIPFASLLALGGAGLDALLHLPPVLQPPLHLLAAAALLVAGGALLIWSYTYLILEGEGGPVPPFSSKTRRLVTQGPYAWVRHPSIVAKLLGVTGLGLIFNSWTFLAGILPLLLTWSIFWNQRGQDRDLGRLFGEAYLRYRRETPMLIPRWSRTRTLLPGAEPPPR